MEKRKYKNSTEEISLLGFGCMRLPRLNEKTQEIDKPAAQAMVDYAIEHGINYFDTAHPYHEGLSEPFIGEALSKYPRHSFNLATKMPTWLINDPAQIDEIFAGQLKKCKVDYFDYYLIHNIGNDNIKNMTKHHIYEALQEKKRQGKIRRLGFSFHAAPPLLQKVVDGYDWDFAQIQLNYLDWELQDAKGQYEILTKKGIPVNVMEPVRGGALASLSPKAVALFKEAAPDASPASWALRYAASLPNVLTVLSGMSNIEQLKDNVKTIGAFKPLDTAEYETVAKALTAYRLAATVPCTACGYCMDCPAGVDIPKNFAIYNNYCTSKNSMIFSLEKNVLGTSKQSFHCVKCGKCLPLCPQHINIPECIDKINELTAELSSATPA